ncbi:hypothetical protein DFJ73DRAFT_814218 [Zopfochytrium polystomum]|nr:hypothetical protein DFJ73DRAFT_814218 [Zopfochytrium polystomum]
MEAAVAGDNDHYDSVDGQEGGTAAAVDPLVAADVALQAVVPNVDALTLEFIADPHDYEPVDCRWVDDEYEVGGSIYISLATEDAAAAAAAEAKFAWRRVVAETWRAVATKANVRNLTVRSLPPNMTTAWCGPEWAAFVGRLEYLSISVWGADNGAGWRSITTEGYCEFLTTHLKAFFFDHASGLLSLDFVASPDGTYGGKNLFYNVESNLGAANMPHLRRIRMQNCCFDPALLEFLRAHASTLEAIHLVDVMSETLLFSGPDQHSVTWAELFDGIASAAPPRLREFSATSMRVPVEDLAEPYQHLSADELDTVRRVRLKLAEEGGEATVPLFFYGWLDDKYGNVSVAARKIVESFAKGEDAAAYGRLMEVVRTNRDVLKC